MKLKLADTDGWNTITAYGEGYVNINGIRRQGNVVVLPDRLVDGWTQAGPGSLTVADFELLAGLDAEIFLLGTGGRQRFPGAHLLRPLIGARKVLETMDLPAACRTYNVLAGEGRKVAACLLFD